MRFLARSIAKSPYKTEKNCDFVDCVLHIGLNFRPCFQEKNVLVLLVLFFIVRMRKKGREREIEKTKLKKSYKV